MVDTQAPDAAPVILPAPTKAPFVIAGWLDGDTLLGFTSGSPSTVELRASTWTIGDTAWRETGVTLSDTTQRHPGENAIAASLSPDGQSILVRWQEQTELDQLPLDGIPSNEERRTQARLFRLSDGAAIPLPGQKGTGLASWDGWGCRPAWQDGRPLITDHVLAPMSAPDERIIAISDRFNASCISVAGDQLRGAPAGGLLAVLRVRVADAAIWLVPALLLIATGIARLLRRRRERP